MSREESVLPMCAVCGKPVDRITRRDNHGERDIEFTVYCHGGSETTRVPVSALHDAVPGTTLQPDVAFRTARLAREGR